MAFDELTRLSQLEAQRIHNSSMTADEAYAHLTQGLVLRTFVDTLRRFCPERDLSARLVDGLCALDAELARESVARKVRDWLGGRYAPAAREDYIKLCFILALGEEAAQAFLTLTTDNGFHLRDPREIAFAYCLRTGKTYPQALALAEMIGAPPADADRRNVGDRTVFMQQGFRGAMDDEAFLAFARENRERFGTLHNTAYASFMRLLDLLQSPRLGYADTPEESYSLEEVVSQYLRMDLPLSRNVARLNIVQKTIRKYWPNATSILRMKNREEDVTRKVLLLLYLVTEGGVTPDDYDAFLLDEDFTDAERFEQHYWRLNTMLAECGMSRLDPRNLFDWLVMYGLRTGEDDGMGEKVQSVLQHVFGPEA